MYCSPTMPPPAVPCGRSAIRSEPESLAISPDGSTLFVAGTSLGVGGKKNNVLLAYDAATGSPLWSKRYQIGTGEPRHKPRRLYPLRGWHQPGGRGQEEQCIARLRCRHRQSLVVEALSDRNRRASP